MSELDPLVEDHLNGVLDLAPELGTVLGLPERDDRWPDPTEEARAETLSRIRAWRHAAGQLDAKSLSDAERLDIQVFGDHLDLLEFAQRELAARRHDPDLLSPLTWTLLRQVRSTVVPPAEKFQAVLARLQALPAHMVTARAAVHSVDGRWLQVARQVAAQGTAWFQSLQGMAAVPDVPASLQADLAQACEGACQAVADHMAWLDSLRPGEAEHWLLTPDEFSELCRLRRVESDLRVLREMGARFVADCELERRRFAFRMQPHASVQDMLARIRADVPATLEEGLQRIRDGISRSREFVLQKALCTFPPGERLEVMETPAALRPLIPFAALLPPQKFAAEQVSVYLVTSRSDGSLADFSRTDVQNTVAHEGYPGHHVQQTAANVLTGVMRDGTPLGHFADPSASWATDTVEGWAHYGEELMLEEGFEAGAELRLQMAQDALWRAHRMVIDVDLSTGAMSCEQAMERLVQEVGMHPEAARAEVNRYTRSPGYQLCYLYGKHRLRELRTAARARWRNTYTHQRFHDLVLQAGNIPLHYMFSLLEQTPVAPPMPA